MSIAGPEYDFQDCEISIAGRRVPFGDAVLARDIADCPPRKFQFEFPVNLDCDGPCGFDLSALLGPPRPQRFGMVSSAKWFGGTLRLEFGDCVVTTTGWGNSKFDMSLLGFARRCEFEKSGRKVAWDPLAVAVWPCVKVG